MGGRKYGGETAEARRARRRAQLLDAGAAVVRRDGVRNATFRAICAEAGLSERYFYESFKNLDDLLTALCRTTVAEVENHARAAADEAGNPRAAMLATITSVVEALERDDLLAALILEDNPQLPSLWATRNKAIHMIVGLVQEQAEAEFGTPLSPIEEDRLRHASALLGSGFLGLLSSWRAGDLPLDREQIVGYTTDVVLTLFQTRARRRAEG